jgi:hypothetical protein
MSIEQIVESSVDVAGIDVGLTLLERTSGVCRTGVSGEVVDHTFCDYLSRASALGLGHTYAMLAIDGPVLPANTLHYEVRACEKAFVWGAFQKRCKPGESQIPGTGQALRRGGVDAAHSFRQHVADAHLGHMIPQVVAEKNIIEAFPNGFLGVAVPEGTYAAAPGRGDKFDWLYEEWCQQGILGRLKDELDWQRPGFWSEAARNRQHDERAAIVCALTAVAALRGRYVAVGESTGGYFFLPPWSLWQSWAKEALDAARQDRRLPRAIEVWIDGACFLAKTELPR